MPPNGRLRQMSRARAGESVYPSPKRQRGGGHGERQPARLRSGLGSIALHRCCTRIGTIPDQTTRPIRGLALVPLADMIRGVAAGRFRRVETVYGV